MGEVDAGLKINGHPLAILELLAVVVSQRMHSLLVLYESRNDDIPYRLSSLALDGSNDGEQRLACTEEIEQNHHCTDTKESQPPW